MKLLRTFTMIALLSGVASADTAPAKAPAPAPAADKKPAPAADKKAPATPPAPAADKKEEEVSTADAEKFLVFFNKIADTMVANKDDCTKLAASLNGLIDANGDLLKKANESKASGKKLPKALEDKMMARVKDMMPAMQKCQNDKGVMDAMKRMDGNGEKAPATPAKAETKAPTTTKTPAPTKK